MRVIRNYDCTSLYPSIMIQYGFLSRSLSNASIYKEVYDRRIQAKKDGDLKTSNALKLALNTSYGILLNKYNDMFDPRMGRSVCITGQLLLTDLVTQYIRECETVKILNTNTDGVMISIDDSELPIIYRINDAWEKRTRITLEEDKVQKVILRDVNNYVIRFTDGKIKAKGGVVSDWKGGDFKHNSLSIVCKAITLYLLDKKPVMSTIMDCDDPFSFQMIVKAGGSYVKVVHETSVGDIEVNRTNRVYASNDERLGAVYKVKDNGRRDRIANCPEHAIVDNLGTIGIDKISKQWYIDYAEGQINKFMGVKPQKEKKKRMGKKKEEVTEDVELTVEIEEETEADTVVAVVKKPKKAENLPKEKEPVEVKTTYPSFQEKLFQLGIDLAESAKKFVKDGYNSNQSYEYVKAQQYKTMLRDCLTKNRLRMHLDDMIANVTDVLKSEKMVLTNYHAQLSILDVDSDSVERYMIWAQGSDNLDKGLSKAKTLAIKDFVKANFGVSDAEDDVEADIPSGKAPKGRFSTPADTARNVETAVGKNTPADPAKVERLKNGIEKLREAMGDKTYGQKTLDEIANLSDTELTVRLSRIELKANDYDLEI